MRVACIGLLPYPTRFWASALIAKPHVLMADNIIPAPKRRHTGIASARRAAKRRRRRNDGCKREGFAGDAFSGCPAR